MLGPEPLSSGPSNLQAVVAVDSSHRSFQVALAGSSVAGHVRVRRSKQKPDLQLDETAHVVAAREWHLVGTHLEHGISSARDRRPAID